MYKFIHAILTALMCIILSIKAESQTVFWTETFNNGSTGGTSANGMNTVNGAWSIDNLSLPAGQCNDAFANVWYVSCTENGNGPGVGGTSCTSSAGCGVASATNATLHIGSTTLGDVGAAYDAGGLGGCGLGGTSTYTRVVSPLVSTVGKTGITVIFNYIENGEPARDFAFVEYSTNGGTTWSTLVNPLPVTTRCGVQGLWTASPSYALPVAADNNANVKIRFVWQNDDNALGTDPSVAINDLKFRYTVLLPIELTAFTAECKKGGTLLKWTTATETDNNYFTVEKAVNDVAFIPIAVVKATGTSTTQNNYSTFDDNRSENISYYRLKQTDYNGHFTYSNVVVLPDCINAKGLIISKISIRENELHIFLDAGDDQACYFNLFDIQGRKLIARQEHISSGKNEITISIDQFEKGIYFLNVSNERNNLSRKIVLAD